MSSLKARLISIGKSMLDFYAKAVYIESSIVDSDGEIIGHEWHGLRIGEVVRDFSPSEDELSEDHQASTSEEISERE